MRNYLKQIYNYYLSWLLPSMLILIGNTTALAQRQIKVHGVKINRLDKQKRKQGEWIFFDRDGIPRLSCHYWNNQITGPTIWYNNRDTVFVRFPYKDGKETFVFYEDKKRYLGDFIYTSDTTYTIEIDPDSTIDNHVIQKIKEYKNAEITPVYFFAQKKLRDYLAASFSSSNFIFNKPLNVLLTINSSGIVTNVEFPKDKNDLSVDEERELYWIYSKMPRWQPLFINNKTQTAKILLSNNLSVSVVSF